MSVCHDLPKAGCVGYRIWPFSRFSVVLACALLACSHAYADTEYYKHIFFDNSRTTAAYYFSSGKASAPSSLVLENGRLPVETSIFFTPPNALRLQWTSASNGSWETQIDALRFRNREILFDGDTLYFWCFSPGGIMAQDLPELRILDSNQNFSGPLELSQVVENLPAGEWVRVRIPLDRFASASIHTLNPRRLQSIVFSQGRADTRPHTLIIDEIALDSARQPSVAGAANLPSTPQNLRATGYERHIDLTWQPVHDDNAERYIIYRSTDGRNFKPLGIQIPGVNRYSDFVGNTDTSIRYRYKVTASDRWYHRSPLSEESGASTRQMTDDELLTMLQEACFRYYWEGAHPDSGMIRENIPGDDRIVATAATGFGIMAMIVGVERGFITREQGVERLRKIVEFLQRAPRYHGAWSHFMDGASGQSLPVFDMFDNGGDLVETAFLIQGLLAARAYFVGATPQEKFLHDQITQLWEGVEWDWYRKSPPQDALFWHWSPDWTWHISHRLTGFNEVMIVYLLGLASPTHPIPPNLYYTGWAGQSEAAVKYRQGWGATSAGDQYANGQNYFGIKLDVGVGSGGPLFFTHYSYMGFDPRALTDTYTNYFENNQTIARINLAYCIENPGHHKGYGANAWGLTASDGPWGYAAESPQLSDDQGTIAPTGALASFPYAPEASLAAFKHYYRDLGDLAWDVYGPIDAFNLDRDWYSPIYMGLNQAPIAVMLENYRSGLVWKLFHSNPEIQKALMKLNAATDQRRVRRSSK